MGNLKQLFPSMASLMAPLTGAQRAKARTHIGFAVLLSLAEVASLAAVLPLLLQLGVGDQPEIRLPFSNLTIPATMRYELIAMVAIVFAGKNILAMVMARRQLNFLNQLYIALSEKLYRRYFQLDWIAYTRENSSDTFHKIRNTAYDFSNNVLGNYFQLLTDAVTCLLIVVALVWLDYRIVFALMILCVPVSVLYLFFHWNILRKIDNSFRKLVPQANIALSQGIESFAEAKLYKTEHGFIHRFMSIISITSSQMASLKVYAQLPARLMETLGLLLLIGLITYVQFFPSRQPQLVVMLGLVSLALYRVVPSLNRMILSLSQIQAYGYAVSELEKLHDTHATPTTPRPLSFRHEITLRNVSFSYVQHPPVPVLKQLSCKLRKGEFILVEGPSGCGKTTLLYLLAGLIRNYEGFVHIDSVLLNTEYLDAWQSKISIVQQTPVIYQDTLLSNICAGKPDVPVDMKRIEEILEVCGLSDHVFSLPNGLHSAVGEHGITLSGGQRQRLSLARALYRDPEILLLDEVTNQLDESSKIFILGTLRDLAATGKTIVFSSHDRIVRRFATQVLRMEDGAVVEEAVVKQKAQ